MSRGEGVADLHPALLMFIAQRYVENRVSAALADAGFGDVTLAQARLVARIGDDGNRLTDLAEQAQITKQSAGFLVDQLEKLGYVERRPDPTDARARLICLTPRARDAQRHARTVERAIAREWRAHLGDTAYDQMAASLTKLREITDPYA
jgi:DNA-binding MarR family transcriptional regulator